MRSSRPVPLWLVLLAIPYWGAVAWLTDASPFQPADRAEPAPVVVPAPPPAPGRCYYSGPNELRCDHPHYRFYRQRGVPHGLGDFPAGPHFQTLGLARGSYERQLLLDRGDRRELLDPFGR
jgi:hypothetical protein